MTDAIAALPRPNMREGFDPLPGTTPPEGYRTLKLWAGDEFSFEDLLDFVNPLQHIPVVSSIYRELTGDKIGAAAQLTVGAILGGPIGFIGSVLAVGIETETGKSAEQYALAVLDGSAGDKNAQTARTDERRDPFASPAGDAAQASVARAGGMHDAWMAQLTNDRRDPFAAPLDGGVAVARAPESAPTGPQAALATAPQTPATAQPVALRPVQKKADGALQGQAAIPPSARVPSAARGTTPAVVGRVDPAAALLAAQSKSGPWLPQTMTQALDKYEALARQRTETTKLLDQSN